MKIQNKIALEISIKIHNENSRWKFTMQIHNANLQWKFPWK